MVLVAVSYRSAPRLAVVVSSSFNDPPIVKIFPFGSIVAFISMRGCPMAGPVVQAGVAADKSMISVVGVDGFPPPKMITFGVYPLAGVNGNSAADPYVRAFA